jgi:DNA-binding transcriptional ArsR family regulator
MIINLRWVILTSLCFGLPAGPNEQTYSTLSLFPSQFASPDHKERRGLSFPQKRGAVVSHVGDSNCLNGWSSRDYSRLTKRTICISIFSLTKINKTPPMKDPKKLAHIFKALSVDKRIRIIHLLKQHPLCVGELSTRLGITQGAASQHLRVLREAQLVKAERRGYFIHYRLDESTLTKCKGATARLLDISEEQRQMSACSGRTECRKHKKLEPTQISSIQHA